jgi:hypothetical protein
MAGGAPADVAEVSGLAFSSYGQLLAHGDERGIVWRYDLESRRPAGRFGLRDHGGVLRADFEDVTVVGERLFLGSRRGSRSGRTSPCSSATRPLEARPPLPPMPTVRNAAFCPTVGVLTGRPLTTSKQACS